MDDVPTAVGTWFLLKLVGVYRQSSDITMSNEVFGVSPLFRIVEHAVSINTVGTVLEQSMTENVIGGFVIMVPHQWNDLPIAVLERIFSNSTSIRTTQIVPSGIAPEIISHFDFLLTYLTVRPSMVNPRTSAAV